MKSAGFGQLQNLALDCRNFKVDFTYQKREFKFKKNMSKQFFFFTFSIRDFINLLFLKIPYFSPSNKSFFLNKFCAPPQILNFFFFFFKSNRKTSPLSRLTKIKFPGKTLLQFVKQSTIKGTAEHTQIDNTTLIDRDIIC